MASWIINYRKLGYFGVCPELEIKHTKIYYVLIINRNTCTIETAKNCDNKINHSAVDHQDFTEKTDSTCISDNKAKVR